MEILPTRPPSPDDVPSGTSFGRAKAGGKITRQRLDTDIFATTELRLGDFLKDRRERALRPVVGVCGQARAQYEADLNADLALKEASKLHRPNCIKALLRTWPGLDATASARINDADCRAWASRFAAEYDGQFFNNTLSTFRHILERAGVGHDDNPAFKERFSNSRTESHPAGITPVQTTFQGQLTPHET